MPYSFVQVIPDFTVEEYRSVVEALGDEPFEGLLLHLAGPVDGGWRIIQVWRSADDYAHYARDRLWKALADSGGLSGTSAPLLEWLEVAHLVTSGREEVRELGP
jgi:hypothetical protein